MSLPSRKSGDALRARAAAAAFLLLVTQSYAQSSPFLGLDGSWSGNGTIKVPDGPNERIRCRVTYVVNPGGSSFQQNMRCASDSYKFDVKSDVAYKGGQISGTWTETSKNMIGTVSGRVRDDEIQVAVKGSGFGATMFVQTRGDQQSVKILPQGMGVTEVSIRLDRSKS